jgi:hypothetical protein
MEPLFFDSFLCGEHSDDLASEFEDWKDAQELSNRLILAMELEKIRRRIMMPETVQLKLF